MSQETLCYLPEPLLFGQRVVAVQQRRELDVPQFHRVHGGDDAGGRAVLTRQTHAELIHQTLNQLSIQNRVSVAAVRNCRKIAKQCHTTC